jgi:hypothetical protein
MEDRNIEDNHLPFCSTVKSEKPSSAHDCSIILSPKSIN